LNTPILIANILTLLAFFLHTIWGDKDLKLIEPKPDEDENYVKQEKWTMARGVWHVFSFDLLVATLLLGLINFTGFFVNEILLLQLLSFNFLGYGIAYLITIVISKKFPKNYLKLGQWILMFVISVLIYSGIN